MTGNDGSSSTEGSIVLSVLSNPDDWWMSPVDYARRLSGLTVNLLSRDVEAVVPFHTRVLGATAEYVCVDFASFAFGEATWMVHADHTYDGHPLHVSLGAGHLRGVGAELRLHGRDPDAACQAAGEIGATIIEPATTKPHGTREAFILDPDGYLWVPDILA